MEDQSKDYTDPKRRPKRNCSKQLQTNTNGINNGRDLLLTNKP